MKATMYIKTLVLVATAGLMMGNTGCEKEAEAPQVRSLKRIVEVGKISAQPIHLPDGQIFDLEFVINQQFPDVLVSSDKYTVLNKNLFDSSDRNQRNGNTELLAKMGLQQKQWFPSKEAECLVNLPQFRLSGVVNSYEWVAGGGLTIGYSPAGQHAVTNIGGTVNFDKAQMDLTLRALHPIDRRINEVANITKDQIKTKVGFSISFGLISIGPEFYFQKGLAQVTKEALEKAMTLLRQKTDNREWYTRVGHRNEDFVTIIGGRNVGLVPGDMVSIHNTNYYWEDEEHVCNPDYYKGSLDGPAIGYGEVIDVSEDLSMVQIDDSTLDREDPLVGSVVKLHKLKEVAAPAPPK